MAYIKTERETKANLLISPEHEYYKVLKEYLTKGLRFKLDEGEFYVSSFEMKGDNLCIWLEEL